MKLQNILRKTRVYLEKKERTLTYLKRVAKTTRRDIKDLADIWKNACQVATEEGNKGDWDHVRSLFRGFAGLSDALSEEMLLEDEGGGIGAGVSAGDVAGEAPDNMIGKPIRIESPNEDQGIPATVGK